MALAIGGPSEVPLEEALLRKRCLVGAPQVRAGRDSAIPYSVAVSVALVVLPVLLGVNPLSSVSAVELDLDMVPFGHRTCTTCRQNIQCVHKFSPCIVGICFV